MINEAGVALDLRVLARWKNIAPVRDISHIMTTAGEMAEWFKAHAWKA